MRKEEIFNNFSRLFPEMSNDVVSYKKIGGRAISIHFNKNTRNLAFIYYSDTNWSLGTKLWRNKPEPQVKLTVKDEAEAERLFNLIKKPLNSIYRCLNADYNPEKDNDPPTSFGERVIRECLEYDSNVGTYIPAEKLANKEE